MRRLGSILRRFGHRAADRRKVLPSLMLLAAAFLLARSTVELSEHKLSTLGSPAELGVRSQSVTRLALGSGLDQRRPEPDWTTVLALKPELFIFAGNTVYGAHGNNDASLAGLRAAYDLQARKPGLRHLRESVTILATWSDHDYGLEDGDASFPYKTESKALFLAFWGEGADSPRARHAGLYDARLIVRHGKRLQILLLDTRSFRDPFRPSEAPGSPGRERYSPDADPVRTLLGEEQWTWLEEELRKPADLRLIVSPLQVLAEGHGFERWGNFPRERQRLFDLVTKTEANGVILLSGGGDFSGLYRQDSGVPYPFFELSSSGLNHPGIQPAADADPTRIGPLYLDANFGVIDIDWYHQAIHLELRDARGQRIAPEISVPLASLRAAKTMAAPAQGSILPGG